jgi:mRNA interferase HigB
LGQIEKAQLKAVQKCLLMNIAICYVLRLCTLFQKKPLTTFYATHPMAEAALIAWHQIMEASIFESFAQLKQTFGSVDSVKPYVVFDIAGNHFRLICVFHFNKHRVDIRHVFTHSEFDQWNAKKATK